MTLQVRNLSFAYGRRPILKDIDLPDLEPGSLVALIGPNAAGKSTLFRCVAGLLKSGATIRLQGDDLASLGVRAWAERVTYMPQSFVSNAALTVFEVVLLARKQLHGWQVEKADVEAVAAALRRLGIEALSEAFIGDLSGGQQQMVSVCQALVRRAEVLLLDEPTSALDLRHQLEVMELLKRETQDQNWITVVALHDLNLAARYAEQAILLRDGEVAASGPPSLVLETPELAATYGVAIEMQRTPSGVIQVTASL